MLVLALAFKRINLCNAATQLRAGQAGRQAAGHSERHWCVQAPNSRAAVVVVVRGDSAQLCSNAACYVAAK